MTSEADYFILTPLKGKVSRAFQNFFSRLYSLAPKEFDYKKLTNRELSLLLLQFNRRDRIDVFSRSQYKFQQNSRYQREISVEELDKLQQMKPELRHFIFFIFGLRPR